VLLSHNGFDVDQKLAADISGIDVILTGHTHDVFLRLFALAKRLFCLLALMANISAVSTSRLKAGR